MAKPGFVIMNDLAKQVLGDLGIDLNAPPAPIQPYDFVSCVKADKSHLITKGFVYIIKEIKESDGVKLALVTDDRSLGSNREFTSWHPLDCFEK